MTDPENSSRILKISINVLVGSKERSGLGCMLLVTQGFALA
jgi:hypothetical protein